MRRPKSLENGVAAPVDAIFVDRASDHLANDLVRLRKLGVDADGETGEPPPLRAIREVLARHPADEIILATAPHHMTRLLDDLLDVSRISYNKLELRKEPIDLSSVIQMAVETSRPSIAGGRHELTVDLPPEPVYVEVDPVRLAQIFSNLLNNAARYTGAGGHIRLTAARQEDEIVVSVKDDGVGVAAEMLPGIFDIFSQAQPPVEDAESGLGIGLWLVRGLVELHGGSVDALSDGPGKGSEFVVRLPVVVEAVASQTASRSEEIVEPRVTKRRLLIVDDLKDSADSLAKLMELMGHEVHTAYSGEEAVLAAAKFQRLRCLPSHPRTAVGEGNVPHRVDRVGPRAGPPAHRASRVQCTHCETCGPRRSRQVARFRACAKGSRLMFTAVEAASTWGNNGEGIRDRWPRCGRLAPKRERRSGNRRSGALSARPDACIP